MSKSKVLSVRLSLESLQSCFDLCEALGNPTNGASGAIARAIEILTRDLRNKGSLPSYTTAQLHQLVETFIAKKNPTSMMNLESLSNFNSGNVVEIGRATSGNFTNSDFLPDLNKCVKEPAKNASTLDEDLEELQSGNIERSWDEQYQEKQEYQELIEEQIQEQVKRDEEELLNKIMMGG